MEKQLIKQYYCDPHSILLINPKGQIRRLFTPFKVQCITPIENIKYGVWVYVEEVRSSLNGQLIYYIGKKQYDYHYFCILVGF
jgi:hypothetical protein